MIYNYIGSSELQVSTSCPDGGFKFLENAKDLPTISKCTKQPSLYQGCFRLAVDLLIF